MTALCPSVTIAVMLKIRLQRVGRKHEPTFRVVLTDSKNSTKSGKFHEVLGSYDPRKTGEKVNGERIKEWMGKGAQLSPTVFNLLVGMGILSGKKVNVLPKKSPVIDEEKLAAEKAAAEAAEAARIAEEEAKKAAEAAPAEEAPKEETAPAPSAEAEEPAPTPEAEPAETPSEPVASEPETQA